MRKPLPARLEPDDISYINERKGPMSALLNSEDAALRQRAARVVPSGMWGHLHAAKLPDGYPQFFSRGEGAHLWDADGRRYLDFMCSWGPNLLGHGHAEVEEAAERQRRMGDCLNGPAPVMVDLAETLVGMLPHAAWALFQKNGTDATTSCVTLARLATGRRKLLVARGAYHGAVPWCSPSLLGVTAEDRAHLLHYTFNDADSLAAAVAEAGEDLAGILVSAFRHDLGQDQEMPDPDFAAAARAACDAAQAPLIIDEVRAGLRLDLRGSWESLGIRPDLCAWSKSIANGHALSAVTGAEWLRDAASRLFVTGSFWCAAVPMAAALATLRVAQRDDVPALLHRLGTRLRDGLAQAAARHGIGLRQSGPPQMPLILFDDDAGWKKGDAFCRAALAEGVYFHPRHNMFLSAAHTEADIDRALLAAERGFAAIAAL